MRTLRSVLAAAVVLVCALALGSGSAAEAAVVPVHGAYDGVDHHGRVVSLSFNGTAVSHLRVGDLYIGTAPVSDGRFDETCGGGYCFKGQWITDTYVEGSWRYGGSSEWTSWNARTASFVPYTGTYMGRDHRDLRIHFRYDGGHLRAFAWDDHLIGDARVQADGSFSACYPTLCFKGHWQGAFYVVGEWRHPSSSTWNIWDADAYATGGSGATGP